MSIGPDDGEGCPRCGYNSCLCPVEDDYRRGYEDGYKDGYGKGRDDEANDVTAIYPFGHLDPDGPLDQAIVRAWNKGATTDKHPLSAAGNAMSAVEYPSGRPWQIGGACENCDKRIQSQPCPCGCGRLVCQRCARSIGNVIRHTTRHTGEKWNPGQP